MSASSCQTYLLQHVSLLSFTHGHSIASSRTIRSVGLSSDAQTRLFLYEPYVKYASHRLYLSMCRLCVCVWVRAEIWHLSATRAHSMHKLRRKKKKNEVSTNRKEKREKLHKSSFASARELRVSQLLQMFQVRAPCNILYIFFLVFCRYLRWDRDDSLFLS